MGLPPLLSTVLGIPCLTLALILSLPGVQAVRADGQPEPTLRSELPAAGACGETASGRSVRVVDELEKRIAAEQAAMRSLARPDEVAAEGVVVLNNSGYNYGDGLALSPPATAATPPSR